MRNTFGKRTGAGLVLPGILTSCLLTAALTLTSLGCGSEGSYGARAASHQQAGLGTLQLPLLVESEGTRYRLNATFTVTGPESFVLRSEDEPDAPMLSHQLPPGDYSVAIEPGFELLEQNEGTFGRVPARLLSPASHEVAVAPGTAKRLTYRFAVSDEPSEVSAGELEIEFTVERVDSAAGCGLTAALTIPASGAKDVVQDLKRCRIYITTPQGLLSHDLRTQQTTTLAELGGNLLGVDLAFDEDELVVADSSLTGLHVIDLVQGTTRRATFLPALGEGGSYSVVYTAADTALVTSTYLGSGRVPMRRVDLTRESSEDLASVGQSTMLALSGDRSTVAYAEANMSNGEFGRYAQSDSSFAEGAANWFVYEIAVSRDASQYAIPVYGGLLVYSYDGGFRQLGNLGTYVYKPGRGAVYSPVDDVLYVAFAGTSGSGSIEAFDTNTLLPLYVLDDSPGLSWSGNGAYGPGRLRISRDGSLLLAITAGGVNVYPVAILGEASAPEA